MIICKCEQRPFMTENNMYIYKGQTKYCTLGCRKQFGFQGISDAASNKQTRNKSPLCVSYTHKRLMSQQLQKMTNKTKQRKQNHLRPHRTPILMVLSLCTSQQFSIRFFYFGCTNSWYKCIRNKNIKMSSLKSSEPPNKTATSTNFIYFKPNSGVVL